MNEMQKLYVADSNETKIGQHQAHIELCCRGNADVIAAAHLLSLPRSSIECIVSRGGYSAEG